MLIAFVDCVTIVHLPELTPLPKNEGLSLGNALRTTWFCQSLPHPLSPTSLYMLRRCHAQIQFHLCSI